MNSEILDAIKNSLGTQPTKVKDGYRFIYKGVIFKYTDKPIAKGDIIITDATISIYNKESIYENQYKLSHLIDCIRGLIDFFGDLDFSTSSNESAITELRAQTKMLLNTIDKFKKKVIKDEQKSKCI